MKSTQTEIKRMQRSIYDISELKQKTRIERIFENGWITEAFKTNNVKKLKKIRKVIAFNNIF